MQTRQRSEVSILMSPVSDARAPGCVEWSHEGAVEIEVYAGARTLAVVRLTAIDFYNALAKLGHVPAEVIAWPGNLADGGEHD
jgi:hypothetical protein